MSLRFDNQSILLKIKCKRFPCVPCIRDHAKLFKLFLLTNQLFLHFLPRYLACSISQIPQNHISCHPLGALIPDKTLSNSCIFSTTLHRQSYPLTNMLSVHLGFSFWAVYEPLVNFLSNHFSAILLFIVDNSRENLNWISC